MLNLILEHREIVLLVVVVFIFILLWFFGKKNIVKSVLLQAVIDAEARWGAGTGDIKHDTVVGYIKAKFPSLFLIISDKTLDKWIDDMVKYIKLELSETTIQENKYFQAAEK